MNRRKFISKLPILGGLPFVLDSIPFNILGQPNSPLQRLAAQCDTDRVLIILQMHGGNDGINTIIPIADYDRYYSVRANIAIPESGARKYITLDGTLASKDQIGLHPDMVGVKNLYDQGKVKLVQGVSYDKNNGSHFRGRDILFMGGGADDYLKSGWAGRYFKDLNSPLVYPEDFPNPNFKDPLALEFGNDLSLVFHQDDNIPTSISINDPESFFNLVETLPGFEDKQNVDPRGIPPLALANSPYERELNWILGLEQKSDEYDDRLLETYKEGKKNDPNITYPDTYPYNAPASRLKNPLSKQLKIIANLINGGCKTKIYLINIGGFDTHAEQVEKYDATMGNHAALVYHISAAMNAFQQDLGKRGIEEKVLTITTSEFGRRIYSNGSYGTDHGTGAPLLVFGKNVNPGVLGTNPDLTKDNVGLQYDYRQVYASIMKDWMCVNEKTVDEEFGIFWGDYPGRGEKLDIINTSVGIEDFIYQRFKLNSCYPNPASYSTSISFYINAGANVNLKILDLDGKVVKQLMNEFKPMGEHRILVDLRDIKSGMYFYQIDAGMLKDTKKLIVVK